MLLLHFLSFSSPSLLLLLLLTGLPSVALHRARSAHHMSSFSRTAQSQVCPPHVFLQSHCTEPGLPATGLPSVALHGVRSARHRLPSVALHGARSAHHRSSFSPTARGQVCPPQVFLQSHCTGPGLPTTGLPSVPLHGARSAHHRSSFSPTARGQVCPYGSSPSLPVDHFSMLSHTGDFKIGTRVATVPGAWRYRTSAAPGRPGDSIL